MTKQIIELVSTDSAIDATPEPAVLVEQHPLTGLLRSRCDCEVCRGKSGFGPVWFGRPQDRRRLPRT